MLIIIAAVAANLVIGKQNDLPWYLPEDLQRFKELTAGHPVIMGWNTFISILERFRMRTGTAKPLPNRVHFILTSKSNGEIREEILKLYPEFDWEKYQAHLIFCPSLANAVMRAEVLDSQVYVIGGARVFNEAISLAGKMELTELDETFEGDVYFPEFDKSLWKRTEQRKDGFAFATYTK